jgi:hypothetical protein
VIPVLIEPDMSTSAVLQRTLSLPSPAIHWTVPPEACEYFIGLGRVISIDANTLPRSLTSEEEDLVWASLRASSELLYQF